MSNKAHTATLNRICLKYNVQPNSTGPYDIQTDEMIIEVETSASLQAAVERLKEQVEPCYIALTNKEGIRFACELVGETKIGIMDPQGNVIRASGDHELKT